MKTKIIIIVGLVVAFVASQTISYGQGEPAVKILPTSKKGVFKVLYAYDTDQIVTVKFYNEEGLNKTDKIKPNAFQHGFSKKYDARHLESGNFWVEVAAANVSVTYRMVESGDGRTFEPLLEKTTYHQKDLASKK